MIIKNKFYECSPLGDSVLILTFGEQINKETNGWVHQVVQALLATKLKAVIDLVPAYTTLTVYYDPSVVEVTECQLPYQALCQQIETIVGDMDVVLHSQSRLIEIPVCYEGEFAPDIENVANHCCLTVDEVIERHSSAVYQVYFLGFAPGFPYLGGMDLQLSTPRLTKPRALTPAGSVGIAGEQTGVYPLATPGGWQIIGQTPLKLVDLSSANPVLLKAGDQVRFVPVSRVEFNDLESAL